jgi:hypothetical protein
MTLAAAGPAAEHPVLGLVELFIPPATLHGWARQPGAPQPLTLVARMGGVELGRTRADLPRPDLAQHGFGACAFQLDLARPIDAADLAEGRLDVLVEPGGTPLPVSPGLRPPGTAAAAPEEVVAALEALDGHSLAALRGQARPDGMAEHMLGVMTTSFGAGWAAHALQDASRPVEDRIAWLPLPVGLVSGDGAATLGRGGWLFLTGGPNQVRRLYPPFADSTEVARLAAGWVALSRARQAECARRGIGFTQLVIPEKLSLLPDHLAEPIDTPTSLLATLQAPLAELGAAHVPALARLREGRREAMFRRLDTHLSPYGNWCMADAVCRALGLPPGPEPDFAPRGRLVGGDLVMRFFGVAMAEPVADADPATLAAPLLAEDRPAPQGGHLDTRRVWRNPAAERDEVLLVFGNSFAEPHGPDGLCWWLAQRFREVRFVWSPAIDWAEVARVRPAHLLCQTVERYLPVLPAS